MPEEVCVSALDGVDFEEVVRHHGNTQRLQCLGILRFPQGCRLLEYLSAILDNELEIGVHFRKIETQSA